MYDIQWFKVEKNIFYNRKIQLLLGYKDGRRVLIKVLGIRNKVDMIEGIISECYSHVFVVRTKFGNKSFTYTDVLIGNIRVDVK